MVQEFKRSEVIYEDPCFRIHRFSKTDGRKVVVIPPHAGRHGNIAQRAIDAIVNLGHDVIGMELLPATCATGKLDILGLVNGIKLCVDFSGPEPVDLVGICQGGWVSTIYTILHQHRVNKLALFCAPINTKTGQENVIEEYCKTASMAEHKFRVSLYGGVQPGMFQWTSFAIANPWPVFFQRYFDQFFNIIADDQKEIKKWYRNQGWHDTSLALHGAWFLQAMEHHFIGNELYEGTWDLGNGIIPKLEEITKPLYLYGGEDDPVTSTRQLSDILKKVSSKEKHVKFFKKEGHTGPFVKTECLKYFTDEFFA
jgi:poly(3-hydroxybutyrate) depolymerase